MITQDKFSTIAHNVKSVGLIVLRNGKLTAFEKPEMDHDSLLELMIYTWNDLGDLLDEMMRMSDDHDRMTNTLHRIWNADDRRHVLYCQAFNIYQMRLVVISRYNGLTDNEKEGRIMIDLIYIL